MDTGSLHNEDNQIEAVVNESLVPVHNHVNMEEDRTALAMDHEMQTNMLQGDDDEEDFHLHHREEAVPDVRHDLQAAQNALSDTATPVTPVKQHSTN